MKPVKLLVLVKQTRTQLTQWNCGYAEDDGYYQAATTHHEMSKHSISSPILTTKLQELYICPHCTYIYHILLTHKTADHSQICTMHSKCRLVVNPVIVKGER